LKAQRQIIYFVIFMYSRADNDQETVRLYQESISDRQQKSHKIFAALFQRLAKTGI